ATDIFSALSEWDGSPPAGGGSVHAAVTSSASGRGDVLVAGTPEDSTDASRSRIPAPGLHPWRQDAQPGSGAAPPTQPICRCLAPRRYHAGQTLNAVGGHSTGGLLVYARAVRLP